MSAACAASAAVLGALAGAAASWTLCRRRCERKERRRLDALVQNVPDGLVVTDLRGDVLYMNAPAREILGTGDPRMRVQDLLKRRTQGEVLELDVQRGRAAAKGFFKTHVALFETKGGEDRGVILLLRDITAERRLDAVKEEFFESMAHDLRAPLFAVQGYLRLLEKSIQPDERQRGWFEAISKSCEKLTLFIQDTLDAARLEAGRLKLQAAAVDPAALAQRVLKLFKPLAEERGIELELSAAPDAPAALEADERLLERVLYNLLSNALKFTPRGGRVRVELSRGGPDALEVSVSDTGPGVPENVRGQIFEKFRQAEGSSRAGFGLGLNICAKIVKLHGGSIWVESEPGLGADFIFRLPLKSPEKTLK